LSGSPDTDRADFETIEAAVMETERGRWFLAEFARRVRAREAGHLLRALDRLEGLLLRARAEEARASAAARQATNLARELADLLARVTVEGGRPLLKSPGAGDEQGETPKLPRAPPTIGSIEARLLALADIEGLPVARRLDVFR
jgi:hypothetical protein